MGCCKVRRRCSHMIDFAHIDPWANESKVNIRWLSRQSGGVETDCLAALKNAKGDLQEALRRLQPSRHFHKYPDWYYLGPFKKVEDPDRDLPVRENTELSAHDIAMETDRNIGGERLIAPFNDANSIGDISGCILSASGYPKYCDPELMACGVLQWNLAQATDRIREKVRRSRNIARNRCFETAIRVIEAAKDLYFDRKYEEAEELLWKAEELLRTSNKP